MRLRHAGRPRDQDLAPRHSHSKQRFGMVLTFLTAAWFVLVPVNAPNAAMMSEREMTSQEIADAIADEIRFDGAVSLNNIDIEVRNGIVTLSGTADNLLEKERATRIAETVKGVRSVIDRIEVKPYWGQMDWEIEKDAAAALARDPATDSWEIHVDVSHGTATLTGTVDSWQEKHLAEQVVKGVRGVAGVENEIEIDYDTDRPAAEIIPEIERILRFDVLVDDQLIEIHFEDGVVRLTGTVGSAAERQRARDDAWVSGVREVDASGLKVAAWARDEELRKDGPVIVTDESIREAIESAFFYDPRVPSGEIVPEVKNGVVTLRGDVRSLKAKWAAGQDARNTLGVIRVINRIKVDLSTLSPQQLETNIANAIRSDPYLERYDITVTVIERTAYLSGSVDSYFEKGHADDLASRVPGVAEVQNNIIVDNNYPIAYDPYVFDYYPYDNDWYDYQPKATHRTDTQIREDIISQLWWSPFLDQEQIEVTVEDGVATLTGKVDTTAEWFAATENAYEGGAVWVKNNLVIATQGGPGLLD